jgi:pilus assembly protein TadC
VNSPLMLVGFGTLFVALLVALLTVFAAGGGRGGVTRTLKTVDRSYRLSAVAPGAQAAGGPRIPLSGQAAVVGRTLTPPAAFDRLSRRLDEAGNPSALGIDAVLGYKGLLMVVGGACGLLVGMLFSGPLGSFVLIAAGAAIGFFAPNLLVLHLAQERQQEIRRTLPDILDTLVVTVEAGMGLEAALAQIVHNGRGPMVGEFARVLHEMQIGRPRVESLRDMGARTSVTELKTFASSVVQATALGIPMAKVLRQQAEEMRIRRRQRAEELAQKVPVKILFPMVLCLLPALFVVIIGPGALKLMAAFGH